MTDIPEADLPMVNDTIETAYAILDKLRESHTPETTRLTRAMLLDLLAEHGGRALGGVWMIWAYAIAVGLDNKGLAVAALFPASDGSPDIGYARNAVTLARERDYSSMADLVDAVFTDQESHRTGANIERTSAALAMGAITYGDPGTPDAWRKNHA